VFREHYKQLGSPLVCAEFDADNFDRVTAKVQGRVTEYQAECKVRRPSPRRRWNAQWDLPTYKAGDAADLKSETHQSWRVGASQTAPEASELGMGTGDPAHSVVARSLTCLKLETHSCQGNYRSPWYQSAARCLQTCCASAWSPKCTHEAQAAFRSKRSCEQACSHPQEAGKANKTVYAFFLDVRKAYDTVWRDGLSAKLLEGVDGKLWRVLQRPSY
jgi:hypothetical protein